MALRGQLKDDFGELYAATPYDSVFPPQKKLDSLVDFANGLVDNPASTNPVSLRLLRREPATFKHGYSLPPEGFTNDLVEMRRWVTKLDGSFVPIQGPPGTGKTYTAARLISALIEDAEKSNKKIRICLLYTSPSPRDRQKSRMPSSA